MSKDIRVEIYGQVYSLRTDLDPAYIESLAETVDARMRALARQTESVDTRRLAVLAALNLADENHQLQQGRASEEAREENSLPADFASRLAACHQLLDAALPEAGD